MEHYIHFSFNYLLKYQKSWQLLFLLLMFNITSLVAQVDREFWFVIPKETQGHGPINIINNVSFKIANTSSNAPAHVKIEMPANGAFVIRTFTIPAGLSHVEIMATSYAEFDLLYANPSAGNVPPISGINNRGIHITSDIDITVYYDYDNFYNRDLFSLKGKNALGTEFFTPFQTIWDNGWASYDPDPISSVEIVATEDGTDVYITPPTNPLPIFKGTPDNNTFLIKLNKGDTYTLVANSKLGALHPSGTYIRSTKKIAVTTNDDSVGLPGGCYDIAGDQMVPVNILKNKYIVMTGAESRNFPPVGSHDSNSAEQIFVLATRDNTCIQFYDNTGAVLYTTPTLAKGKQDYYSVDISNPNNSSIFIQAVVPGLPPNAPVLDPVNQKDTSNRFAVWHITGVGCEIGGAIVPPIFDCTGSSQVSFYKSTTVATLSLNLMIRLDKGQPFGAGTQSYNFFTLIYSDGTPDFHIPGSWFEENSKGGWAVLKKINKDFGTLLHGGQAHKIVNSVDVFHLGIINGQNPQTNKYGYFSSFNADSAQVRVADPNDLIYEKTSCFGDTVYLTASGGLNYSWYHLEPSPLPWSTAYLSDPKSPTPQVFAPVGKHKFICVVKQAKCFGNDTLYVDVEVLPQVPSIFTTDKTTICDPDNILFTATDVGATKYEWKEKIGSNSETLMPPPPNPLSFVKTYNGFNKLTTPINITYKLTAIKFLGCSNPVSKTITVYPEIKAQFVTNPLMDTIGCHPHSVTFVNKSNGNVTDTSYYWTFGDFGSTNVKNPKHAYQNWFGYKDSIYHTQLVVTSPYYCRDTARQDFYVHPYIKAGFTADTVKGCSPLTITLINNSLNKPAIKNALGQSNYVWDFGDGSPLDTTSKAVFSHSFPINTSATSISYKVILTVKNNSPNGCPDTVSRIITVYPSTAISFIINPNLAGYCDSTVVQFTAIPSAAITSYLWDFGDGNTSTLQNPSHLFTNLTTGDITYNVKLTGMSSTYCNGYATKDVIVHAFLDPQFGMDISSSCAPFNAKIKNKSRGGIIKYDWYYGDLNHDNHSVIDTIHTYRNNTNSDLAPSVKLVITNSGGCKDSVSQRLDVYPEIKADFKTSVLFGCNPLPVNFTNQSTYVNSIPPVAKFFLWDFNDGTSSTDKNPSHIFTNTSSSSTTYQIKLTVNSEHNCTHDTIKDVSVLPFLEAKFSVDSVNGCSPFPVTITNASRGKVDVYQWIYGDGIFDGHSSINYSHTYLNNSTNNPSNLLLQRYLKLIVSNSSGLCTSRDSVLITIYPEVLAKFQADVTEGCNPLLVKFTNLSGPGSVPVDYFWDYGDNGTYTTKFKIPLASHTFSNLGGVKKEYITNLTAVSQYKCSHTFSDTITVYPLIKADFAFDQPAGCSPYAISIRNASSSGAKTYYWYMGDKPTPFINTGFFPSYTYHNQTSKPITYSPKLVVYFKNGTIDKLCGDSMTHKVTIYPEVTADFTQDTLQICSPNGIAYTNNSSIGPHKLLPYPIDSTSTNWTFGDNSSSGDFSPKTPHFYTNYSNTTQLQRKVTLDITSKYLCTSSKSKTVTIYPKPKARFEVEKTIACPPFLLPIQNLTDAEPIANFNWNFGDGDSFTTQVLETISHTFENLTPDIASYNLELFVETEHNCSDKFSQTINVYPHVIADFAPDTVGCSPLLVIFRNKTLRAATYRWDFGDQITGKIKSPTHKYFNPQVYDTTYTATLIGISQYECSNTITRKITVYPQPEAEFSALPSHLYFPDNRISIKNETNIGNWNFNWNFADGQGSILKEPKSHEFMHWGGYDVQLKVSSLKCSDSISHHIRVFPPIPIADLDMSENGCVPWTIKFTDKSTWVTSYYWEFDDSSTSTEQNPSHIYEKAGKYQVKLTVTGDGGSASTYRTIEVYPKPTVSFKYNPSLVMLGDSKVQFYNSSKLGTRFVWDFGDSVKSSELDPFHIYKELGKYNIILQAWSVHDCYADSLAGPVEVIGTGVLRFPNAFKPNINGPNGGKYSLPDIANQVFHPFWEGIVEYRLEIYDRLGEKLFDTSDPAIGWDGYYKSKLCKSDVYIWKAIGKFTNGKTFDMAGDVTLLK